MSDPEPTPQPKKNPAGQMQLVAAVLFGTGLLMLIGAYAVGDKPIRWVIGGVAVLDFLLAAGLMLWVKTRGAEPRAGRRLRDWDGSGGAQSGS